MKDTISPVLILLAQLLGVLGLLSLADRWLHRHLQGVMYLLTGDPELALWLYAIVLLPGVCLHEVSHALTANLLGVKTGRMKLLPSRANKRIQLGFVMVEKTNFVSASLIGLAPLLIGSAVVILVGHFVLGTPAILDAFSTKAWPAAFAGLADVRQQPSVWLWVYLVFTVANTMLPSRSDIHAWPALAVAVTAIAGLMVYAGLAPVVLAGVGRGLTLAVQWVVLLGASTLLVDLPVFLGIFVLQKLLETFKGVQLD